MDESRALLNNAAMFQVLAETSLNWEYWLEQDGSLGYISPACLAITGYAPDDFLQEQGLLLKIVHPEDRIVIGEHFHQPLDHAEASSLEFRVLSRTGDVHWISHHCHPVHDALGKFLGRRVTNQDISHQKKLEAEQEQAKELLLQLKHQIISIQEAERQRISQDLHDDIGQELTALVLQLNDIRTSLPHFLHSVRRNLLRVSWGVETLMNRVRQLAYQLKPPSLDSMSLPQALQALCASFSLHDNFNINYGNDDDTPQSRLYFELTQHFQKRRLNVDFSVDENLPVIPEVQATALYRMVQEGLTNVIKHAHATSVWINLDYDAGEVSLSVEDNGQGFTPGNSQRGMGLAGIRERFILLNGSFEIEATPGGGTRLSGSLPLSDLDE